VAPDALLFGMEGLLSDELAASLPGEVAGRLRVTAGPAYAERLPAAGRAVAERLRERRGHEPDAHAVYAYEAAGPQRSTPRAASGWTTAASCPLS
jgi:hypothetical protein